MAGSARASKGRFAANSSQGRLLAMNRASRIIVHLTREDMGHEGRYLFLLLYFLTRHGEQVTLVSPPRNSALTAACHIRYEPCLFATRCRYPARTWS